MDWCDIENILIDGTKEQILSLRCPDCGGNISYFYAEGKYLSTKCNKCGTICRSYRPPSANCEEYFGSEYTIL